MLLPNDCQAALVGDYAAPRADFCSIAGQWRETLERTRSSWDYLRDTCCKSILPIRKNSPAGGRARHFPLRIRDEIEHQSIAVAIRPDEGSNCVYLRYFSIATEPGLSIAGLSPREKSPHWCPQAVLNRIWLGWPPRCGPPAFRAFPAHVQPARKEPLKHFEVRRGKPANDHSGKSDRRMRLRHRRPLEELSREGPRAGIAPQRRIGSRSLTTSVPPPGRPVVGAAWSRTSR